MFTYRKKRLLISWVDSARCQFVKVMDKFFFLAIGFQVMVKAIDFVTGQDLTKG